MLENQVFMYMYEQIFELSRDNLDVQQTERTDMKTVSQCWM